MPILGNASSGGKGVVPSAPTVGTATVTNATTVSLSFTAPFSKLPITSYTVTSSPSIALSTTGTSSPVSVTGSFAYGTAYTFTIAAVSSAGTSSASSASNSITPSPKQWVLAQTYNSSTTYTVPSGKTKIALVVQGAGGGGGASLNVNSVTAGSIYIANNQITTVTAAAIQMRATFEFRAGVTGVPLAMGYFLN